MSLKTVYLSLQWGCMSMIACELSLAWNVVSRLLKMAMQRMFDISLGSKTDFRFHPHNLTYQNAPS